MSNYFVQVYKDYNSLVESMKHTAHEKQRGSRNHHGSEMSNGKDENSAAEILELSTKLRRAQEEAEMEKLKVDHVTEKLRRCEADLETIPLLRAQVKNNHPRTCTFTMELLDLFLDKWE